MKKTKQIEGVIESMKHNIVQTRRLYGKYHPREEGMIKIIKTLYWVLDLPYGLDIPDHYETGDAHSYCYWWLCVIKCKGRLAM